MKKVNVMNELKLVISEDCGNSPKKNQLKEFNIALMKQDWPFILEQIANNIVWHIVGEKKLEGKDAFINAVKKENMPAIQLEINEIITHGNVASVNGSVKLKNNKHIAFCHVYKFGSFKKTAKIKECTSYFIELKEKR